MKLLASVCGVVVALAIVSTAAGQAAPPQDKLDGEQLRLTGHTNLPVSVILAVHENLGMQRRTD